jgi:Endonuclease-reverse transcriptase
MNVSNNDAKGNSYIYSCNVNGLRTKIPEFLSNILINDFKVYLLCETHLNSTIGNSEIFPNDFDVFRCDRTDLTERDQTIKKSHGGGVLIATHKSLNGQLIFDGDLYGAEIICVCININYRKFYLVELYIRPDSPFKVFENIVNAMNFLLSKSIHKDSIIVSGDFNLPDLLWISNDIDNPNIFYPINACSRKELLILDSFHEFGLSQVNGFSNDNDKMLDLIWTNDPDLLYCLNSDIFLVKSEIHHKSIEIVIYGSQNDINNFNHCFFLDFRNADYDIINDCFSNINWDLLLSENSLDINLNNFYSCVNDAIDSHVKLKKRIVSTHPKWFDSIMIYLKNKLNKLRKKGIIHWKMTIVLKLLVRNIIDILELLIITIR